MFDFSLSIIRTSTRKLSSNEMSYKRVNWMHDYGKHFNTFVNAKTFSCIRSKMFKSKYSTKDCLSFQINHLVYSGFWCFDYDSNAYKIYCLILRWFFLYFGSSLLVMYIITVDNLEVNVWTKIEIFGFSHCNTIFQMLKDFSENFFLSATYSNVCVKAFLVVWHFKVIIRLVRQSNEATFQPQDETEEK